MQEKTFNEYEQLMACSFVNWHRIFDKIAFESVVVEIPEHIVQYLLEEMIILPAECQQSPDGIEDENDALDEPVFHHCINLLLGRFVNIELCDSIIFVFFSRLHFQNLANC